MSLKIVHIQTGLPKSGNVAYKLHMAFKRIGYQSSFVVFDSAFEASKEIYKVTSRRRRISAILYNLYHKYLYRGKYPGTYLFSNPVTPGSDVTKVYDVKNADLIYLHWSIGGFLSLSNIKQLLEMGKPVFIVLHDMWNITGGCHHSLNCQNFKCKCEGCPIFSKNRFKKIAQKQLKYKHSLYSKHNNVHFLSPSKWMYQQATTSFVSKFSDNSIVPHFVDNKIFFRKDKFSSRKSLNIPNNKIIIGFGAINSVNNPFKGYNFLIDALQILQKKMENDKVLLVVFGNSGIMDLNELPFTVISTGHVTDESKLNDLYNSFDVFVTPSLAESFGMTALESISSGTPVVCFDIGGLKDIIQHKVNGYRALHGSSEDLARGIEFCLNNLKYVQPNDEFKIDSVLSTHEKLIVNSL